MNRLKPIFHLATLFARREAKTRIWRKLVGGKICRKQVGIVPIYPSGNCIFYIPILVKLTCLKKWVNHPLGNGLAQQEGGGGTGSNAHVMLLV